jgi:hypothetical protein
MATIDLPSTIGFIKASNFYLETNTQMFTSPINKSVQTVQLSGARWRADITLRMMKKADAATWIAFFLKMRGMSETFYGFDPDWKVNRGAMGGTPLVNGAGQTGTSLIIDGCTPNVTGWLKAGDYYSVGGELKRLTGDVDTNGSGQATLVGEPYLRTSPADNAAVTITNPKAKMRLVDDSQLSWQSNQHGIYGEKTFSAFESIP